MVDRARVGDKEDEEEKCLCFFKNSILVSIYFAFLD